MQIISQEHIAEDNLKGYSEILDDFEKISRKKFYRIIHLGSASDGKDIYRICHLITAIFYNLASLFSKKYSNTEVSLMDLVGHGTAENLERNPKAKETISKINNYIYKSGIALSENAKYKFVNLKNLSDTRELQNKVLEKVPIGREKGKLSAANIGTIREEGSFRNLDKSLNKNEILTVWIKDVRRKHVFQFNSPIVSPILEISGRDEFKSHLKDIGLNPDEVSAILGFVQPDDSDTIFTDLNNTLKQLLSFYNNEYDLVLGTLCFLTQALFAGGTELLKANAEWMFSTQETEELQDYDRSEVRSLNININSNKLSVKACRIQKFKGFFKDVHSEVGLTFDKKGVISGEYASFYQV